MSDQALILTYHGVEAGPGPLWIEPARFRAHLDCLEEQGARLLTLSQLVDGLTDAGVPERAVAITFDDGMLSVVQEAAPLLVERGMSATIFCVAGRLGQDNAWGSNPQTTLRRSLAGARALSELAAVGFEIGSHGMQHAPLHAVSGAELTREIVDSKAALEQQIGAPVSSFAYPYGVAPREAGSALIRSTYRSACCASPAYARAGADVFELPRVDIHYLRRAAMLARAAQGSLQTYIGLRRGAGRIRRYAVKDYAAARAG